MPFDPSQFEGTIFMLLVLTAGMMVVRMRARLDNNWLVLYWALLLWVSYTRTNTWDVSFVAVGAVAAMLLRFEFMAAGLITAVQVLEFVVWGYILYHGCVLVFL